MRLKILICLLLAGITLILYRPVGRMGFIVYDDHGYVTTNTNIQSGITFESVRWAFTTATESNWHPLTWLSHMLDYKLFGLKASGHHWVSLGFHIVNTLLLFLVILQMTGALWRSALVAALFAWHPLHIQSVAWISERKDVLSACFMLLTLWAYVRHVQKPGIGNPVSGPRPLTSGPYWLALLFFALGLMSKPMLVTLPLILLLLDFWPLKRISGSGSGIAGPKNAGQPHILKKLILEKIPFFGLSLASGIATLWAQGEGGSIATLAQLPLGWRLADALVFYTAYLQKMFWPVNLSILYQYERMHLWEFTCNAMMPVLLTILIVRRARSQPYLMVGWLWFLIMLVPVIGLVQVGGQAIADRYTYLPSIGLFIIIAWGMADMAARSRRWQTSMTIGAAALLTACLVDAKIQLGYWQNSITLFKRAADLTHGHYCYFSLACAYLEAGELDEAARNFRISIRLSPKLPVSHYRLGYVLSAQGKYAEAQAEYSIAAQLDPGLPLTQRALEKNLLLENLRGQPDALDILNNLAWMLATSGEPDIRDGPRAVQLAEHACELTHHQKTVFIGTLAAAYAEAGRFDDAIATAQQACALAAKNGETDLLQKNQGLLELYRAHKPYRE